MILTRPFRKPFWLIKSFVAKHKNLILLTTAFGIIFFLLAKNLVPLITRLKPTLKIGIIGQYSLTNLPPSIAQNISRGLVKTDSSGRIEPDLAARWEILQEQTLYRFYLKPDVLWNDNTLLNSNDIQLEIEDVTISYPETHVIDFKLKESYAPFLTVLSRPLFKDKTVSTGDYLIKKTTYAGPYLKTLYLSSDSQNIIYRFYPSHQSAWLGFRLGEVDRLENLIINPLNDQWTNKLNLDQTINKQKYLAILFNVNHPQLSNKPLRQALAYAIKNKSASPESRALSPISPDSWAYNPSVKAYDYNPDQAKELFSKATEEASLSGQLEITLATSQSFLNLAETIAESWKEVLNVKTNVKIINSLEPDFQAILVAQDIPLDPDQHAFWHSTQDTNITHYSDLKIDKLLEDGRKTFDQAKRKEIYQDFQRFLSEDVPAIFLSFPTVYTISRH